MQYLWPHWGAGAAVATILLVSCAGSPSVVSIPGNGLGVASVQRSSATSLAILASGARIAVSPARAGLPPLGGQHQILNIADSKRAKAYLYAALDNTSAVYEYAANDKKNKGPLCAITGAAVIYPLSIGVDQSGTLWVPSQNYGAIQSNAYPITSYAPNCASSSVTLEDPNGDPTAVAFDSKGTIYVMEGFNLASGYDGEVSVFPKGYTSPTRILSDQISGLALAIGIDSKDNVYVLFLNSSNTGSVVEFKHGKASGTLLGLNTTEVPGGTLTFDKNDNMLINENNVVSTLEVFAPPYVGNPATYALKGASHQCALTKRETHLACADYGNNSVDVFSYPSIVYQYSVTAGIPRSGSGAGVAGVSYDPAAPN
jgi:hypothetical protein